MVLPLRSRIAPTPSGYLHIGNAYNFLLTEALTKKYGGSLCLRIDDLDAPRVQEEYLQDIFDSLEWLGIRPDTGPQSAADHAAHYTRQLRIPHYERVLRELVATGKVFACTCSRKDVADHSVDGQYAGTCRDKGLALDSAGVTWRYSTEPGDIVGWDDGVMGPQTLSVWEHARDFVIRRRDGIPAYHVASLCDDVSYDINLIVRGEDLLYSTAAQFHLATVLGMSVFTACTFYHHPLIMDEDGNKLSKSGGSTSLNRLRASGVSHNDIRAGAAGWYLKYMHETW